MISENDLKSFIRSFELKKQKRVKRVSYLSEQIDLALKNNTLDIIPTIEREIKNENEHIDRMTSVICFAHYALLFESDDNEKASSSSIKD